MSISRSDLPREMLSGGGHSSTDDRVAEGLAEFYRVIDEGQIPDRDEFLQKHADVADQLAPCLDSLELVRNVAPQMNGGSGTEIGHSTHATLGEYRIIREIGRGGMGVVYQAEQASLGRHVALKVLPFASVLDPKRLQRFKNEAQAAAQLKHGNIVGIYSVGCDRGVHYYAMELIEGRSLAEVIGELRRTDAAVTQRREIETTAGFGTTRCQNVAVANDVTSSVLLSNDYSADRLDYFRSICRLGIQCADALEYAHQMGVLHRDIKPSNLILDAQSHLWVTDFGLAMSQTDTALTQSGELLGTLRYMSPEQASGQHAVVDQRADVYALGLTLYELLILRPAFEGQSQSDLLRQIMHDEPTAPRRIDNTVPRDLETIVLKAAAKEADARYTSARELADDLDRFLQHKPIRARRFTLLERFRRWARHNRLLATLLSLLTLILVCLAVGGPMAAINRQKVLEREGHRLYDAHMNMAHDALQSGEVGRVRQLLEPYLGSAVSDDPAPVGFEWYYLWKNSQVPLQAPTIDWWCSVHCVAFSSDGRHLAVGAWDGNIRVFDALGKTELWHDDRSTTVGHYEIVRSLAFSADGSMLATISREGIATLWDAASGRVLVDIGPFPRELVSVAISSDNQIAIGFGNDTQLYPFPSSQPTKVRVWSIETDHDGGLLKANVHERLTLGGLVGSVSALAFSPDGKTLIAGCDDQDVRRWDMATGNQLTALKDHVGPVCGLAFSPDGALIAASGGNYQRKEWYDGEIRLWDASTGTPIRDLTGHRSQVMSVAFSPNGQYLASGSRDRTVRLWEVESGDPVNTMRGHGAPVRSVAFSPDGRHVASGSLDNAVKIWDVASEPLRNVVDAHEGDAFDLTFSRDSRQLASASGDRTLRLWNVVNGTLRRQFVQGEDYLQAVSMSPDATLLAAGGGRGDQREGPAELSVYNMATGDQLQSLPGHTGVVLASEFSPNGRLLASSDINGAVRLWDVKTGQLIRKAKAHDGVVMHLAFFPDGETLASSGGEDGTVKLWAVPELSHKRTFSDRLVEKILALALSPDGKTIAAAGSKDTSIVLWDVAQGRERARLRGHTDSVFTLDFSPDGRRLASGGADSMVKIWDLATQMEAISLREHWQWLWCVKFSPDGQTLASACSNGLIRLHRAASLEEVRASIP